MSPTASCEESVAESQGRRSSELLGFFLQPMSNVYTDLRICPSPTARFLPTSDKGKTLGLSGALDETLSFIGQTAYILKSSGGLLLCSFELSPPDQYCICNPINREWQALPRPNKCWDHVDVAFTCRGGETSLDQADFTVVRARFLELSTTDLEMETFSSETGEWIGSRLTCAQPFMLKKLNFEMDGVIYWVDIESRVLAYDMTLKCLELIEQPLGGGGFVPFSDLWGTTEGRILYVRHDRVCIEVWTLEKKKKQHGGFGYEFVDVVRANLGSLFQLTPEMVNRGKSVFNLLGVRAIHPHDRRLVLLAWNLENYWYNHESCEVVHQLDNDTEANRWLPVTYFPYEWPSADTIGY